METISKHTPGPWHVYRMGNYYGIDAGSESGMESDDCTIVTFGDADDDIMGVRGDTYEQMVANAKLIAAAPDLLSKLEQFITLAEQDKLTYKELEEARKLIFRIKN